MTAPSDINLIPQTEVAQQTETHAIKLSTIISLILLVIVIGVSGVLFYIYSNLKTQNTALNDQINSLRTRINSQSAIEINARNLDKKYSTLVNIFDKRIYYSMLLTELKARKPQNLDIDGMEIKDGTVIISGKSDTYIAVSDFVNNLLNTNFSDGNPKLQKLFTSVVLNTVELSETDGRVEFLVVVSFDATFLKP
jgi:Tfp pilus assembly protein PilN